MNIISKSIDTVIYSLEQIPNVQQNGLMIPKNFDNTWYTLNIIQ